LCDRYRSICRAAEDLAHAGDIPAFIKPVIPDGLTATQRASLAAVAPRLDELDDRDALRRLGLYALCFGLLDLHRQLPGDVHRDPIL
jgi:hypothetical protein